MFKRIFIEEELIENQRTKKILSYFPKIETKIIKNINDIFGRVKKPYLQKRENLQLFIGKKRGSLVKQAPEAYGVIGDPHYYFIHAYNCVYECEYCYLQGYFNSPDIVLFINHEDIGSEIVEIVNNTPTELTPWFHAGEFSDSLALSHITGELPYYFSLFNSLPNAKLEFRTKSVNIKELLTISPLQNIIISFSLSPKDRIRKTDLKTPPLTTRLIAIKKIIDVGHPVGIHLDPIIYEDHFEKTYQDLIEEMDKAFELNKIEYISIGVVRFTSDVFQKVKNNYPKSDLLSSEFIKGFDNKVRYSKPMRMWMLSKIKDLLISKGIDNKKVYLCME